MTRTNTITGREMRDINRSAVLDFIRRRGPTSKTLISQALNVSLPTAMRIVDELIEDKLVVLTGDKEYSGGRRRMLLELNAQDNVIIGVDLGRAQIYGAVADLGGRVLVEQTLDTPTHSGEESYARLVRLVRLLLDSPAAAQRRILGLGVGTQGLTVFPEGIVRRDLLQQWTDFPLKARLEADFSLPVVVDNDVNLAAFGELWFGAGQQVDNLVLITQGTGIGAAIIIDGSLYRSNHYLAGEVGYFLPDQALLGNSQHGFGTLESRASLAALQERARQMAQQGQAPDRAGELSGEEIFEAMQRKEAWAGRLVDEMLDHLAMAVLNVCALLDPDLVVLRSGLDRYTGQMVAPILERIENLLPRKPALAASQLGYKATALGAIVEVLQMTTNFYHIRNMG